MEDKAVGAKVCCTQNQRVFVWKTLWFNNKRLRLINLLRTFLCWHFCIYHEMFELRKHSWSQWFSAHYMTALQSICQKIGSRKAGSGGGWFIEPAKLTLWGNLKIFQFHSKHCGGNDLVLNITNALKKGQRKIILNKISPFRFHIQAQTRCNNATKFLLLKYWRVKISTHHL